MTTYHVGDRITYTHAHHTIHGTVTTTVDQHRTVWAEWDMLPGHIYGPYSGDEIYHTNPRSDQ